MSFNKLAIAQVHSGWFHRAGYHTIPVPEEILVMVISLGCKSSY
jgi:hypothetical protein